MLSFPATNEKHGDGDVLRSRDGHGTERRKTRSQLVATVYHSSRETYRGEVGQMRLRAIVDQLKVIEAQMVQTFQMEGFGKPQPMSIPSRGANVDCARRFFSQSK